jgi:beta-ureidopropionase / N-carbamoyl-L-amino-acid hydrolase
MQVQFRDTDEAILARFAAALQELCGAADRAGPCRCTVEGLSRTEPRLMDPAFEAAIEAAAEGHVPGGHLRMPSGAGHDAQVISHKLRAGMMFIPSLNGISHHWSEDTKEEDIVLGAQVFADAAAAILKAG